ncbi:hypothetical protein, partial [Gardnerella vaginalis]|uniref:hypothetical protein n=1 Tax=Gardnerella vaginalis TaxID=2702 RepID=UPI00254B02C8
PRLFSGNYSNKNTNTIKPLKNQHSTHTTTQHADTTPTPHQHHTNTTPTPHEMQHYNTIAHN